MTDDLLAVLERLRAATHESSTVEFKSNLQEPKQIGEYLSALANSAALERHDRAWLVWGVEDETHRITGTTFDPQAARAEGNQRLTMWLQQLTNPRADFTFHPPIQHPDGRVVMLEIHPARSSPIAFSGRRFIRVDSHKCSLADHPQKEARLWDALGAKVDWTGEIVADATLADLDPEAVQFARDRFTEYRVRGEADASQHDRMRREAQEWDVPTLLNKARVTKGGRITRTALLLLGRDESAHFLAPVDAKISWILRDAANNKVSSQHFGMPFLTNTERVFQRIRNVQLEQLPGGDTLFPTAVPQYDPWVIREALHNCIAHQDYVLGGKINVVEHPDRLVFTNLGSFLPESVEWMVQHQSPLEHYRNQWLVEAMVRLRMIDQVGSGIRQMFVRQRERAFPLPDFVIDPQTPPRVEVVIHSKILDENYVRALMQRPQLDLRDVLLLDRVQKKQPIDAGDAKALRAAGLIDGRSPNYFISLRMTSVKHSGRGLDDSQLENMVLDYLAHHERATRAQLVALLVPKLPAELSHAQKGNKIRNLLQSMRKANQVENTGSRTSPDWRLKHQRGSLGP